VRDWANDTYLTKVHPGTTLKILTCLVLTLLLAGCIPIGVKSSNLPLASVATRMPTA
jgi:hypothetical protein